MAVVETKIDDVRKEVCGIKDDIKDLKKLILSQSEAQDDKFARKEELKDLQNRFWWILGILVSIIIALKLTGVL